VPVRVTRWGLLLALSLTFRVAAREPVAVGLKVTEMVQWPPAGRLAPQVLVCAKSAGFAPVNVRLPMGITTARLLVRVMSFAALVVPTVCVVNAEDVGETTAGTMPVPLRDAVCGLLEAASVTVSVAVSAPRTLGVRVTVIEQVPFAVRLVPQVLV